MLESDTCGGFVDDMNAIFTTLKSARKNYLKVLRVSECQYHISEHDISFTGIHKFDADVVENWHGSNKMCLKQRFSTPGHEFSK